MIATDFLSVIIFIKILTKSACYKKYLNNVNVGIRNAI